jgi:adenine deaminase
VIVCDLANLTAVKVYKCGQRVDSVDCSSAPPAPGAVRSSCRVAELGVSAFALRCDAPRARVIETTEAPVFTRCVYESVQPRAGLIPADAGRDLCKAAVV